MSAENGKSQEVAIRPAKPLSARDPVQLAQHFAASGYFKDATQMSQAVVKIVAGEELGLAPMASMQGIHIIEGKPSLSANTLATLVKRHEHYDYRPIQITDKGAEIEFLHDGEQIGVSVYTLEMAQRAGLVREKSGWVKFPEAMCFARAMSQGVRWYCPDVTAGTPAYVPEELGAEVDAAGQPVATASPAPEAQEQPDEPAAEGEIMASEEQVEQIVKAVEALELPFSKLAMMIGSIGAEAPKINRPDSVAEAIRSLSPERADALLALMEREGDRRSESEEAPEEGAVEDRPANTEGFEPQLAGKGEEASS